MSDISVLGRHIATGYLTAISPTSLEDVAASVIEKAHTAIGTLYDAQRGEDGATVEMVRTIWSFTYVCPSCRQELVYFEHISPSGKPPKACPSCGESFIRRTWPRSADVPVVVVVRDKKERLSEQPVSKFDRNAIENASRDPRQREIPSLDIGSDREMYSRSGLGKAGLTSTRQFFSPRNAIALLELWRAISAVPDQRIRQKLRFAFTAILPRASRRYQWSAQRPLNAQNQTYYISPVYFEWNVFELFERKVEAALRADDELFGDAPLLRAVSERDVQYDLASADRLAHLPAESVDYVFTDPPFGSNIFYSDMNLFHEAWLGEITDHASEAVVHTTGARKKGATTRYEQLLRDAFGEAYRILKPGRFMSVVFGNSSGRIWGLVQRAMRDAGFEETPAHVAILDKGQRSVKGLNSGTEGVVTVDLIVTIQKPIRPKKTQSVEGLHGSDTERLIHQAISELRFNEAQNPSRVYARILRDAIREHYVLDNLHLSDVLVALRNAGYTTDRKTGLLSPPIAQVSVASSLSKDWL